MQSGKVALIKPMEKTIINMLKIDGSIGEGGGQILRTALTLSMCLGKPVHIANIRAKRVKPGLMRQHLTAVLAAAEVSNAHVEGAEIGSGEVFFAPDQIRGGEYRFSIGTAGSCSLVLQTVLPALLMARHDSQVVLSGGTHNAMSPPFHFLQRAYLPMLQKMGAEVHMQLNRFGFYPAGGGEISVGIKGLCSFKSLHVHEAGRRNREYAESYFAALPEHIAERELSLVRQRLNWCDDQLILKKINHRQGPGNVLLITLEHENVTEVFTGFAEKGKSAESVADKAVSEMQKYTVSKAAVCEHLADQLLLPMALAGAGSFTTSAWSLHAQTNAEVISWFLPVNFRVERLATRAFSVEIRSK